MSVLRNDSTAAQRAATRRKNHDARKLQIARIDLARATTRAIVASGKCPDCGGKVKRNLSLTGWWQCEQFGSEPFRARQTEPACSWQGFTE